MKIFNRGLLLFIWALSLGNAFAGSSDSWINSAWNCYSGDHSAAADVTKAETVPLETFSNNPPKPTFILKPGETPEHFKGLGLSHGMTITTDTVSTFQGHTIYCFTCKHTLVSGEPAWTFDWAVIAGDVTKGSGPKLIRIFFVEDGGGGMIRGFGADSTSNSDGSTGIEIGQDIWGNGVEGDKWIFRFAKTGPWLVESGGSGRHEPEMTFHYNKVGKVTKVEKDDDY